MSKIDMKKELGEDITGGTMHVYKFKDTDHAELEMTFFQHCHQADFGQCLINMEIKGEPTDIKTCLFFSRDQARALGKVLLKETDRRKANKSEWYGEK